MTENRPRFRSGPASAQAGFSLVELMISLVLGLIVIGGVTTVFLSNQQSYRSNEGLSQLQENSRIAFELMARDIRQAGLTGCGNNGRIANVLANGPNATTTPGWYADFDNAVLGYEGDEDDPGITTGTSVAERVAGTDSMELIGLEGTGLSVANSPWNAANFKINETSNDLRDGDIIIICDPDHAAILQVTNYQSTNVTVVHNSGNGSGDPGNCSKGLGYPTDCSSPNGNQYQFGPNSQIAKYSAVDWYIGKNKASGRSLYRKGLVNVAGKPTPTAQEMVRNVTDMQIQYHRPGLTGFVDADAIGANWRLVDATRITLRFESANAHASTQGTAITRELSATITLRNRVD